MANETKISDVSPAKAMLIIVGALMITTAINWGFQVLILPRIRTGA